jgi:Rps23 Pro-64 3,4-dihydroxylase Tpa1-like proline 4-hydroxylase
LGWPDLTGSEHTYLHSEYSVDDVHAFGIFKALRDDKVKELLAGAAFYKATVNLSVPGDVHYAHTHKNLTMLYYANPEWRQEWAGETLFFSDDLSEVVFTSVYKPGRIILFDGGIPHTIRPQSRVAPQHRTTVALFFNAESY